MPVECGSGLGSAYGLWRALALPTIIWLGRSLPSLLQILRPRNLGALCRTPMGPNLPGTPLPFNYIMS